MSAIAARFPDKSRSADIDDGLARFPIVDHAGVSLLKVQIDAVVLARSDLRDNRPCLGVEQAALLRYGPVL